MVQQATVTVTGFVGADPAGFGQEGSTPACSFRLGSTRSYFNVATGRWVDHPTTWITVKAFRSLALNIRSCVHEGDPVIVSGLLNTEEWQRDGVNRTRLVIEANSVGHDLSLGTSDYRRMRAGHVSTGQSGEDPSGPVGRSTLSDSSDMDSASAAAKGHGHDSQPGSGAHTGTESCAREPEEPDQFGDPEF